MKNAGPRSGWPKRIGGLGFQVALLYGLLTFGSIVPSGAQHERAWGMQTAQAQTVPPKTALCSACHGDASGAKISNMPSLAGQPRVFLENTLVLIREGVRDIPAMKGAMDGVTDEEIIELAKHYSGMKLSPPPAERDEKLFVRGKQVADQTRCGTCHLPDYAGREQMPRLAWQRQDYLLHTMREFQANRAVGRDTIMAASLLGINDADVQAMAHFFAQGSK